MRISVDDDNSQLSTILHSFRVSHNSGKKFSQLKTGIMNVDISRNENRVNLAEKGFEILMRIFEKKKSIKICL